MLSVKQVRGVALLLCSLAVVLTIASLALPKMATGSICGIESFGKNVNETVTLSASMSIGAFQACFDVGVDQPAAVFNNVSDVSLFLATSACSFIDSGCKISLAGFTLPPDDAFNEYGGAAEYGDMCVKFNVFRGMLSAAAVLLCVGLMCGLVYVTVDADLSPKCSVRVDVLFAVLQSIVLLCFAGALVAANAVITGVPDVQVRVTEAGTENDLSIESGRDTSFMLASASTICVLLTVIVWVVGKYVGSQEHPSERHTPLLVEPATSGAINDCNWQEPPRAEGAVQGQQQQQLCVSSMEYGMAPPQYVSARPQFQHPAPPPQQPPQQQQEVLRPPVRYAYRYRYQPMDGARIQQ